MPRLYTNARDAFPFGDGSVEFAERYGGSKMTMPTAEHEYRGHRLTPSGEENFYYWKIEAVGFSTHPMLKGNFTDVPSCERAIDQYWQQHP
jgi:hypothetical protein